MLKKSTEINILEEIPKKFVTFTFKNGEKMTFSSESYEILYKSIEKYGFIKVLGFNLTKIINFDKDFDSNEYLRQQRRITYDFMRDTFPLQILRTCIITAIQKYWQENKVNISEALELVRYIKYEPTAPKAVQSFVAYTKKICNYDELYYKYSWNVNNCPELEPLVIWLDLSKITTESQITSSPELNGAMLADWAYESSVYSREAAPPIYIVGIRINDKLSYVSATADLKQFFYDMILKGSDDEINRKMEENGYRFVILEVCNGNEKWTTIERKVREYKGSEVG